MPTFWIRRLLGNSPQSVVDYTSCDLIKDDSINSDAIHVENNLATTLPLDLTKCKGFQDLPDELLELIFRRLEGGSRKTYFAICGVSRSWRNLGQRIFFSSPWNTPHLICHPNQLFCLSPRIPTGSRSGLLRCFVRREKLTSGDIQGRRITLHIGKDPQQTHRARFLLSSIQCNRNETLIYLNSKCQGPPCAHLIRNLLSTKYSLVLDPSISIDTPDASIPIAVPIHQDTKTDSINNNANNTNTNNNNNELHLHSDGEDVAAAASQAASPSLPDVLLSLQYKARIKGLMQPRRMEVSVHHNTSVIVSNGELPLLRRHSSMPPGNRTNNNNNDNTNTTTNNSGPLMYMTRKPSLGHLSAVAAMEIPCPTTTNTSNTTSTSTTTTTTTTSGNSTTTTTTTPTSVHSLSLPPSTTEMSPLPPAALPSPPSIKKKTIFHRMTTALVKSHQQTAPEESFLPLPTLLYNKSPHWNEMMRCWCLNFRGRVKFASVKNFQLVIHDDEIQKVVMQFGKVDQDTFILDFNPTVLSAVQAFGIALSTFDGKIML